MDSLTDELLLHTLSFVSDGLTLLDAVPQVCKRWHTYRRDLRIWASADLASSKMGDLSRLLLHAPAAHSLRIGGFGYQCDPESVRRLTSALRRTAVVLSHSLEVDERAVKELPPEGREAVVCLMQRHAGTLRHLSVFLPREAGDLLAGIAKLQGLRCLWVHVGEHGLEYSDQLSGPTGRLAHLCERGIFAERRDCGLQEPDLPDRLVLDLVDAAATSLRSLDLDLCQGLPFEEVAAWVTGSGLQRVVLRVHEPGPGREGEAFEEVSSTLDVCEATASLRRLNLTLSRDSDESEFSYALLCDCKAAVQAFMKSRPDVDLTFHLEGSLNVFDPDMPAAVGHIPLDELYDWATDWDLDASRGSGSEDEFGRDSDDDSEEFSNDDSEELSDDD